MSTTTPHTYLVFVYGTLRMGYGLNYLLSSSWFCGVDCLPGFLMYPSAGGSYPAIVHSGQPRRRQVVGEVYRVTESTLHQLDRVEGFRGTFREHNHYWRESAVTAKRDLVQVYVQPRNRFTGGEIPTGNWLDYAGPENFGTAQWRAGRCYERRVHNSNLRRRRLQMQGSNPDAWFGRLENLTPQDGGLYGTRE